MISPGFFSCHVIVKTNTWLKSLQSWYNKAYTLSNHNLQDTNMKFLCVCVCGGGGMCVGVCGECVCVGGGEWCVCGGVCVCVNQNKEDH